MDNKLKQYTLAGIIFTVTGGFCLQITYYLSSQLWIVAIFAPVNTSLWEQLKLLFIPMALFAAFETGMLRDSYPRLLPARIYGIAAGLLLQLSITCTYYAITAHRFWLLDFISFAVAVGGAFLSSHWIQLKYRLTKNECERSLMILTALIICFVFFTFVHPNIALFTP